MDDPSETSRTYDLRTGVMTDSDTWSCCDVIACDTVTVPARRRRGRRILIRLREHWRCARRRSNQ
jgi:hypothetical protein